MKDILLEVISNETAAEGVFRLDLRSSEALPEIKAGQFLNIEVPDKSLILRRPFCIYSNVKDTVTIFVAKVGKGTESLSQVKKGDFLKTILPLGVGFDLAPYKKIALLGGGLGCAALYNCLKTKGKEFYAYLGFAKKERVLFESDFKAATKKTVICTDDGSYGVKNFPIAELIKDINIFDAVFICGPSGLVKSAKKALEPFNIPAFVSMEQRMGCGIGACLVCTCGINENGTARNKRVCADGPVFNLRDLIL